MGRRPVSPNSYDEQRLQLGMREFRCEVCNDRWPESLLVVQDGHYVCRPNCAYPHAPSEQYRLAGEAKAEAARLTAEATVRQQPKRGIYDIVGNLSVCTGIKKADGSIVYPTPIPLARGGSVALTLTGQRMSSADTISYTDGGLSTSVRTDVSATQVDVTVSAAAGMDRGDYEVVYSGSRFINALQVR